MVGPVYHVRIQPGYHEVEIEILCVECTPASPSPFGSVLGGFLKVRGLMVPLRLKKNVPSKRDGGHPTREWAVEFLPSEDTSDYLGEICLDVRNEDFGIILENANSRVAILLSVDHNARPVQWLL